MLNLVGHESTDQWQDIFSVFFARVYVKLNKPTLGWVVVELVFSALHVYIGLEMHNEIFQFEIFKNFTKFYITI